MAIHKVIEISEISDTSWEDAVKKAVTDVAKSVRNIKSVYVKEQLCEIQNDKVVGFRIIAKVTFEVES